MCEYIRKVAKKYSRHFGILRKGEISIYYTESGVIGDKEPSLIQIDSSPVQRGEETIYLDFRNYGVLIWYNEDESRRVPEEKLTEVCELMANHNFEGLEAFFLGG